MIVDLSERFAKVGYHDENWQASTCSRVSDGRTGVARVSMKKFPGIGPKELPTRWLHCTWLGTGRHLPLLPLLPLLLLLPLLPLLLLLLIRSYSSQGIWLHSLISRKLKSTAATCFYSLKINLQTLECAHAALQAGIAAPSPRSQRHRRFSTRHHLTLDDGFSSGPALEVVDSCPSPSPGPSGPSAFVRLPPIRRSCVSKGRLSQTRSIAERRR